MELNELHIAERSAEKPADLNSGSVKAIFGMLYDILALYEASGCYNYIPGTKDTEGAWGYFEGLIENARKKLTVDFLGKRDDTVCQRLDRIIGEHWDRFMGKWSDDALEFGDIQVMVFKLTDNGIWSHEQINPLYLEPETPENADDDKKQAAFITAANALVEYFKNETEQSGWRCSIPRKHMPRRAMGLTANFG